jgi:hypothetical protein
MEENEEVAYLLGYPGVRELVDRMTLVINERTVPPRLWNAMVDGQRIEGDPFMTDARSVAIAVVVELFANVTESDIDEVMDRIAGSDPA